MGFNKNMGYHNFMGSDEPIITRGLNEGNREPLVKRCKNREEIPCRPAGPSQPPFCTTYQLVANITTMHTSFNVVAAAARGILYLVYSWLFFVCHSREFLHSWQKYPTHHTCKD